ncbi:hypothetical protein [Bradyrhizobium vignae]|uniref:hypothetical protein n=1 Tax=Bradyrhizobium vignae TaxID=1549949 RepID=UPI00135B345E|nr:hypothetical protein [Bradyrhizobium vignae]
MHIYLPPSAFSPDKLGVGVDGLPSGALRFESAVEDPLLGEMARAVASELRAESCTGRLLVETLACSMAARLVQRYVSVSAAQSGAFLARAGLDRRRVFRIGVKFVLECWNHT